MDTSIVTQFNPPTGQDSSNLLETFGAERVNVAPQIPRQTRVPEAMARRLAPPLLTLECTTAQHFQIGTPISALSAGVASTSGYELDTDRGYVL